MNTAVGSQLALLPFASPASGLIYTLTALRRTPVQANRSVQSLPSVEKQSAATVFSWVWPYQYFKFDKNRRNRLKRMSLWFSSS